MAGRRTTHELSSFSRKRAAEMSAAKQRLSGRTEVSSTRSGRRSVGRVLGYSIMLAVLLAAICAAIAFTLRWPGITRFYHGIDFRSARANLDLQRHFPVPVPAAHPPVLARRADAQVLG
jgi:hypothetical protein